MAVYRIPRAFRAGFFAILLAAGSFATLASTAPPPTVSLGDIGPLIPNRPVTVTWDPLPPDTEEFELLLRCESPVTITLRLTESEDPALTQYSWRVPGIPCDRARILLRHGRGGRETTWAQSLPFAILETQASPAPRVEFRQGEYWVSDEPAPDIWTARRGTLARGPGRSGDACESSTTHRQLFDGDGTGRTPDSEPKMTLRTGRTGTGGRARPHFVQLRI